jgi:response regulator RpfG family c-di-GMP phosphodiesterase
MISVLYIDDDLINLYTFENLFGKYFNVYITSTFDECVEILKTRKINVLVTDKVMPEIDGIELIIAVKKIDPTVVCVLTSSHTQQHEEAIFYRFVEKPWDINEVVTVIEQAYEINKIRSNNEVLVRELIKLVDNQHKIIDKSIKKLEDIIINRSKSIFLIDNIKNELYSFYKTHFIIEEALMKVLKITDEDHISEHRMLLEDLVRISNSVELIIFLKKWNTDHVGNKDLVLMDFFTEDVA